MNLISLIFFSHTIKKQPYNREVVVQANFIDRSSMTKETIVRCWKSVDCFEDNKVGIVGVQRNSSFWDKFELFKLLKAETLLKRH
jgi:hypothetical protein